MTGAAGAGSTLAFQRHMPEPRSRSTSRFIFVTGGVVEELCRMLGADSGDAGARRHVEELLAAA